MPYCLTYIGLIILELKEIAKLRTLCIKVSGPWGSQVLQDPPESLLDSHLWVPYCINPLQSSKQQPLLKSKIYSGIGMPNCPLQIWLVTFELNEGDCGICWRVPGDSWPYGFLDPRNLRNPRNPETPGTPGVTKTQGTPTYPTLWVPINTLQASRDIFW